MVWVQVAVSWLLWLMEVQLCINWSLFLYLRCSKKKMMFRLLCSVFFVWQPNLCKKQVLKMAVACARAWGHLPMCIYKCECMELVVQFVCVSKVLLVWSPKSSFCIWKALR